MTDEPLDQTRRFYQGTNGERLTHYGPARADLLAAGWSEVPTMPPPNEADRVAAIEAAADAVIDAAIPRRKLQRMLAAGVYLADQKHGRPLTAGEEVTRADMLARFAWSEAVHAEAERLVAGGLFAEDAAWPALPA